MQISVRSQYGKHVPRILRRQLIFQLMQQYLNADHAEENLSTNECKPSIQRFHGALLFVDISGFTALSLQLSPEDLKFHINEYFTKILDIVEKHGGDVIKFAGDALFIVWETSQLMKQSDLEITEEEDETEKEYDPNAEFQKACRLAISTAVDCGAEINETCSNHRVSLVSRTSVSTETWGPSSVPPTPTVHTSSRDEPFALLNIHSGVTIGLMAGIDIGCNDRWEFFLMGEPLSKVAMAEAQASTGEMVVCPEAHAMLHPTVRPTWQRAMAKLKVCNSMMMKPTGKDRAAPQLMFKKIQELKQNKDQFDETAMAMPCGCLKGLNGYCKVRKTKINPISQARRNKIKAKFDESVVFDETNSEIESMFDKFIGNKLHEMNTIGDIEHEFFRDLSNAVALNVAPIHHDVTSIAKAALNIKTMAERVKVEFVKWAHSCLIDDVARHVHDVVRSNYNFEDTSRIDVCRREIRNQLSTLNSSEAVMKAKAKFHAALMKNRSAKLEKTVSILDATRKFLRSSSNSVSKMSTELKRSWSSRLPTNLLAQEGEGFSAEIRSVTVMFVKIDMPHMDLTVENVNHGEAIGQFGFLSKTVNESLADVLLLHRLQSCIEVLTESFSAHGGQLRQFIVDDKGTVCIGTFGLRGAVSNDNAASALETAQMIVNKLQGLGLNCSIGVTMGKAFCGLVGSANRHEYAVMGPSTNLSARLMCKAPPGGIICDREIRNHDRAHQFMSLADIIAKGYTLPVGTFKPLFKTHDEISMSRKVLMNKMSNMVSHNIEFHPDKISGESVSSRLSGINERQYSMESMLLDGEELPSIVVRMLRGPYFGGFAGSDGENQSALIGREWEIKNIVKFLFKPLVDDSEDRPGMFRTDMPARFAGVLGPQGIGKTAVMYAVAHQVSGVVVTTRSVKLHVFKSRVSGFQAAVPFHAWKTIIKEMLMRIHNTQKLVRGSTKHRNGVSVSMSVDLVSCIGFTMSLLPERLRHLEPLFGFLTIVHEEPHELAELGLSQEDLVLKSMELLFEVIQLYVTHTKNLVFIVCEDVHEFDLASQMLLKHLWKCGTGVVCLFSTMHQIQRAGKTNTKTHSFTVVTNAALALAINAAAVTHNDSDLMQNDFAYSLQAHERYFKVELELFTKDQTNSLVKATLAHSGVSAVDNPLLTRIFDESGGNPMYAYELAKTVAHMHMDQIDLTRVSLKISSCHRLEEIICHRFDQLSTSAQSLLKIAAAICIYGATFTYEMISFVMVDHEHDMERAHKAQIVTDLMDIVSSESFLHSRSNTGHIFCDDEDGSSFKNHDRDLTKDGVASNKYTFEFTIALEKSTIYELLLSDQKQVIHERIAEYYQYLRKHNRTSTEYFCEESRHWQRASNWIHAMACSYHASKASRNEHQANEHIEAAYRMYRAMKDQPVSQSSMKAKATPTNAGMDWSVVNLKILYDRSIADSEELYSDMQHSKFTVNEVSHMYNCDPELLKISLEIEVLMSRKRLKMQDMLKDNQLNLEEALQILLLTKNGTILNNIRVGQLMFLLQHRTIEEEEPMENMDPDDMFFSVGQEFTPLCLKIMSAYIENYLQLVTDAELSAQSSKVQFMMTKYHKMAKITAEFHYVHSWSLDLKLHCKVGNFKNAAGLGQKILDVYQFEKHSADLIAFYGCDCIPASLAMISQYLLLSSEWRTPHRFLLFAQQSLERLTHVESISSAVYFVTNSLVFLKRFEEALKLFTHYLDCIAKMHEERTMKDGFYLEWLNRLVRFEAYVKSDDATVFDKDALILDELILNGGLDHVMESHLDSLSVYGRGIDAILAEVCALKIIVLWNDTDKGSELQIYCRALGVYVHNTLTMTSGRPHELMFSKTSSVMAVLHLLQSVLIRPMHLERQATLSIISMSFDGSSSTGDSKQVLLASLRDVIPTNLFNRLWTDCHPQFSIVTLLALCCLGKIKHDMCLKYSFFAALKSVEETPSEFDVNREVLDKLHQLMLNGSCGKKIKVLEKNKLLGLTSEVSSNQSLQ